jgi:hypothetical protein
MDTVHARAVRFKVIERRKVTGLLPTVAGRYNPVLEFYGFQNFDHGLVPRQ